MSTGQAISKKRWTNTNNLTPKLSSSLNQEISFQNKI
jgi:hypothetical protein